MSKLPSLDEVRAALLDKTKCERLFGPLRRDDIVATFKQAVVIAVGDEEGITGVPTWMVAQAAVLLEAGQPGRKPFKSRREMRLRKIFARSLYKRKKQELGSAKKAAEHVRRWLHDHGVELSAESILKGKL